LTALVLRVVSASSDYIVALRDLVDREGI
jgi:hypothetical protein